MDSMRSLAFKFLGPAATTYPRVLPGTVVFESASYTMIHLESNRNKYQKTRTQLHSFGM